MSIAPVQSFPPARVEQADKASGRASQSPARPVSKVVEEPEQPVSATLPKQEKAAVKNASSTYQLAEDVVEVHEDPETKGQIIEYLDKAKNVVEQVPSSEELSVERGIAQELQQAAKLGSSANTEAAASEGGKTHGD